MAMKKAEMEAHAAEYHKRMKKAKAAESKGLYRAAVETAISACAFIDGMMQFERKYEQVAFSTVAAIDVVIRYAPLLLDYQSLNKLAALLADYRRIERDTAADLGEMLQNARSRMWDYHRLWSYMEVHPEVDENRLCKTLGGKSEQWQMALQDWEKMGLLRRISDGSFRRLALSTRMGQVVGGKCSACGKVSEAPKRAFLEPMVCCACRSTVLFVLVADQITASKKG